ncbi:MAG: formylglycine-generating enzyme family protein [Candidatus Wallbacteria bacterium]|nr:formylglycine-generating enzyme family protein [Candidatus Wallbacteria bacterium]
MCKPANSELVKCRKALNPLWILLILFMVTGGEKLLGNASQPKQTIAGLASPATRNITWNAGSRSLEFSNGVKMEFVWIPAGSFTMGSQYNTEKPPHTVIITKGFYLDKYEVTQAQWQSVMGNNPSCFRGDQRPVDMVSWDDSQVFIRKLSQLTGKKFRLPTEAEWEYACRAGTETKYYWGDQADGNCMWYDDAGGMTTQDVGGKQPNAWGLYDMCGNLWEWCNDWYGGNFYLNSPAEDPQGPTSGTWRVLRGGSWHSEDYMCRSANRIPHNPVGRSHGVGIRLVYSP